MRTVLLGLLATVVLACSGTASKAVTFAWSFTDGGSNTGSGFFEAVADPTPDVYSITSVTGTILGLAVAGLSPYGGADNILFWNADPVVAPTHFDPAHSYYHTGYFGIGFTLANGENYDLYEEAGIQLEGWICGDESVPYCLLGPNTNALYSGYLDHVVPLTDFAVAAVAAVPLPATLPLLAAGLGGLGMLGWRRKRGAAAPAPASAI